MTLVNKIKSILESISGVKTVIYDSGFSANQRIDRKPTPAALLYLLTDWSIDVSKGTAKEAAEAEVFFFDASKLDATGEQKDITVNEMETLALEFIAKVMSEKSISVKDDTIRMRSTYGKFDKFCVGVSVHIKLEEKQGTCIDDLIPTPTPNPPQEAPNFDAEEPIDNELV